MKAAKNKKSNNRTFKKYMITFCLIGIITLSFTSAVMANGNKKEHSYNYYESVRIEQGDTLWSIANKYVDNTSLSVNDYIKEIKRLNNLTTDSITYGQYLIVYHTVNN